MSELVRSRRERGLAGGDAGAAPAPTDGSPQFSRRSAMCQLEVSDRSGAKLVPNVAGPPRTHPSRAVTRKARQFARLGSLENIATGRLVLLARWYGAVRRHVGSISWGRPSLTPGGRDPMNVHGGRVGGARRSLGHACPKPGAQRIMFQDAEFEGGLLIDLGHELPSVRERRVFVTFLPWTGWLAHAGPNTLESWSNGA